MNSGIACTVCGEQGHKPSKCKSLGLPPDGFYTGGGGGGGHSHDDDDEHCHSSAHWIVAQNGSQDDEVPSNSQAQIAWDLYSPNTPSNAVVQEVQTQVV
jgi:hypothetical protein